MPDPLAPLVQLPGVLDAADAARRAVDALLTHPVLRRRGGEVAVEAGLRCARASAALDGVPIDGPLRVSAELGSLIPTMVHSPWQAIARIHLLACAGELPDESLGRPRASAEVSARLATLAQVLASTSPDVPAVVVAAVAHGELLALRPFAAGNGVVARAAGRVLLVARGFDPRGVSAPDVGHAQDPAAYPAAASAYAEGRLADWLVHCARAAEHGAREGLAICEAMIRRG